MCHCLNGSQRRENNAEEEGGVQGTCSPPLYETILVPPEAEWTMDMPAERSGTGDGKKN